MSRSPGKYAKIETDFYRVVNVEERSSIYRLKKSVYGSKKESRKFAGKPTQRQEPASMLDLLSGSRTGERHVQRQAGDDGLPCVILGQSPAFDRAPKIDDLLFGYALEEILVRASI